MFSDIFFFKLAFQIQFLYFSFHLSVTAFLGAEVKTKLIHHNVSKTFEPSKPFRLTTHTRIKIAIFLFIFLHFGISRQEFVGMQWTWDRKLN